MEVAFIHSAQDSDCSFCLRGWRTSIIIIIFIRLRTTTAASASAAGAPRAAARLCEPPPR